MSCSSDHQCRRHADMDDELEEGEYVPGQGSHSPSDSDTNTTEYYNRYSSSESDDEATSKAYYSCYFPTNPGDASCSSSSAAANNGGYARSSVAAPSNANANASSSSNAAAPVLACRVCGKEFTSSKAVCGHMKVHAQEHLVVEQGNGKEKEAKRVVAVARGWGSTGKRGCSGSKTRDVSPSSETGNSMAIVIGESKVVLEPTPLAYDATNLSPVHIASDLSGEGSSAGPMHDNSMAVVVAGANPPIEAIIHHQQAAPPPLPAAGNQHAVPPVDRRQRAPRPAAGKQIPDGYTCRECGKWFKTNQALGGHAAGHKNRRLAAAAASGTHQDGAVASHSGSKQEEKRYECKVCSAVFDAGVQLGGHMRKHWKGEPIVPKKKMRLIEQLPLPPPADPLVPRLDRDGYNYDVTRLCIALPFEAGVRVPAPAVERALPARPPAPAEGTVEAVQSQPAPVPPATGRVLLFGVDIGPGVQGPRNREGSQ
jgi:rubredoxin